MGGLFWLPHTWDGRACAATSIAIEDPEHVRIASQIHQRARHFDLDPGRPSDSRLFRHYHRHEVERRRPGTRRLFRRHTQLLAPGVELVAMQPVP